MELPSPIHLQRRLASRNMARFYRLTIVRDLFGQAVLLKQWGRIGTGGRERAEVAPDEATALLWLRRIEAAKRRRGYCDATQEPDQGC